MTQTQPISKNEKRIFMTLVSLLIILVVVSTITRGVTQPSRDETEAPTNAMTDSNNSSATTSEDNEQGEPVALTIDERLPEVDDQTGLVLWPAASSIEIIHKTPVVPGQTTITVEGPLRGVTVILDPGHGGQDGGTMYPVQTDEPEIIEKQVVLTIAQKTRDALVSQGATVVMTRETDEWVSLYKRVAWVGQFILDRFHSDLADANRVTDSLITLQPLLQTVIDINSDRADNGGRGLFRGGGVSHEQRLLMDIQRQYTDVLFISLHCNAYPDDSTCRGLQVYYQTTEDVLQAEKSYFVDPEERGHYSFYDDDNRLRLANTVHDTVIERIPELEFHGDRSVLPGNFAVLREMNLSGVLVEMGFVTNESDRQILTSDAYQNTLSDALAEAILRYYAK